MKAYWASIDDGSPLIRTYQRPVHSPTAEDAIFTESDDITAYACQYLGETTAVVAQRFGDKNILPYMHVVLAYLFGLAFAPNALTYIEGYVPWEDITIFLNTISRSGVVEARFEDTGFHQQMSGTGCQLPKDFVMRGLIWAQDYFPARFFNGRLVDEEERSREKPIHDAARAERCLWLGVQLASVSHEYIHYPYRPIANSPTAQTLDTI
jgi:hypothetical protein